MNGALQWCEESCAEQTTEKGSSGIYLPLTGCVGAPSSRDIGMLCTLLCLRLDVAYKLENSDESLLPYNARHGKGLHNAVGRDRALSRSCRAPKTISGQSYRCPAYVHVPPPNGNKPLSGH